MTSQPPHRPVYIPSRKRKNAEERVNRRVGAYFRFDDVVLPSTPAIRSQTTKQNGWPDWMDAQDYNEWGGVSMPPDRGRALLRQLGVRQTADGSWIWKRHGAAEPDTAAVSRLPAQRIVLPLIGKPRVGVGYTAASSLILGDAGSNIKRSVAGFSLRDDEDDTVYDDEEANVSSIWNRIHPSQSAVESSLPPSHRDRAANLVAYEPVDDSDPEDAVTTSGTAWTTLPVSSERSNAAVEHPVPGFVTGAPCIQRYCAGPELPVDWDLRRVRPPPRSTPLSPLPVIARPPLSFPGPPLPLPPLPPAMTALPLLYPGPPPPTNLTPPTIVPLPRPPPTIVPLPRPMIVALPQPPLPTPPAGPWTADVRAAMQERFAVASSHAEDHTASERAIPPEDLKEDASVYSRTVQAFAPEALLCKRFHVAAPRRSG